MWYIRAENLHASTNTFVFYDPLAAKIANPELAFIFVSLNYQKWIFYTQKLSEVFENFLKFSSSQIFQFS